MSSSYAAPQLPPNAFDDISGSVVGVMTFCLVWSTLMVGLRIWTRWKIIDSMGADDYAIISGLIATYGSAIAIAQMTSYGLGKHVYVMDFTVLPLYLKDFYLSIVFYCAALLFIKLAFLFQYYRVLAVQHMRMVYIVAIVVVGGWATSQTFVGIFTCTPVSGFWDKTIDAKCIPNLPQWYINAGGNIITDVAVFVLPLPALWKLNLAKQQRMLLVGIFGLGFFTVVVSGIRIRYLKMFEDFPWENAAASMWSVGELTSAITCCCLPTLRPLIGQYFPNLGTALGRSTQDYGKSDAGGKHTLPSHADTEMGHKRGLPLSGTDGSEVDLASSHSGRSTKKYGSNMELSENLSPFRGDEDAPSVASQTSELALAPKKPGVVGVRTSIGPTRSGVATMARARSFSGGVCRCKEMYIKPPRHTSNESRARGRR